MIRLIKCAIYIAIVYCIVGIFRYINDERGEMAASMQQVVGEITDSAKNFIYQTSDDVHDMQQDFNDTLQEETRKYISELTHP